MTKVSVKTGDTVLVNSGKDSGKIGKVLAVKKNKDHVRVVVEGVNMVTKAKRARTAQEKSELVKQEAAIDVSNVNVICSKCDRAVRVKHAVVDGKKVRVCPKCGATLDAKYVKSAGKKAEKTEDKKAAKAAAKAEKKSKTTKADQEKKATKTATQKKPTTTRSSQRGV
ncbi:MAG: 50S ribosomal protein L24 [Clostridia bacterium]|nr:50S ribosomal protein L24 [Clostridia bacterium]